ncbi:MAG: hemolysin family protein, partial [Myxococcota bacterium]
SGSALEQGPQVTEEDLEFLVDLGSREGSLEQGTATLLQSAFDYTNTAVRDVMVPRGDMVALDASWDYDTVLEVFTASGHSRAPVYEDTLDNIIGLFYAKDMLQLVKAHSEFQLKQHMRECVFVPEQKKISEQFADFKLKHVHMAVVVDEFGDIRGLVTLEDIIEEIFGEIQDEYDTEEPHICDVAPGVLEVDARCPLPDLEQHLDYTFPEHPEYESLGGFMVTELGEVPDIGAEVVRDGLHFKVIDADAKRVIRVRITDERSQLRTSQPLDTTPRHLSRLASLVWPLS